MQINIRTNFPDVAASLGRLQAGMADQVLARSLNRTMDIAKTTMSREIRNEFNLKPDYVRDRLRIKRAYASAGQFSISAELAAGDGRKGRSANVIAFMENSVSFAQARKRAKDGTLKVLRIKIKRGSVKPLPGAFIGNKGRTVFRRTGNARLPIEPVQTIEVKQMFNTRRINAAVVAAMNARFPAIFQRELAFAMSRAGL